MKTTNLNVEKLFYNSNEVAELLGFTVEYVRKLAKKDDLVSFKPFNNRLLFPVGQFKKMEENCYNKEQSTD